MRSRVLIVLACLTLASAGHPTMPAAAATRAAAPAVPDVYGADLRADQVLPARGIELPIGAESSPGGRVVTQSPTVEAIPTPTAAVFGLAALAVLIVGRPLARRLSRAG